MREVASIIGAMLLAAVASGARAAESTPAAPQRLTVTVVKAKRTCLTDTFRMTGVLVPREEILIRPDSEGLQITQVAVEDGAYVSKGQVLARLAAPDFQPTPSTQARPTANVVAPTDGIVVVNRTTIVGVMASERGEPLFRLYAHGEMEMLADVPAKRLAQLAPGHSARIEVLGAGEFAGRVRTLSPQTDPMTQMGQATLFIGRDERLHAGAFARATIEAGKSCGPTVPISAVLYGSDGAVVQVVREERVETRRVRVGLLSGLDAEISEGLNDGDLVVARAGAFLREGDPVQPAVVETLSPAK
jgi:HlyD family secretion protein